MSVTLCLGFNESLSVDVFVYVCPSKWLVDYVKSQLWGTDPSRAEKLGWPKCFWPQNPNRETGPFLTLFLSQSWTVEKLPLEAPPAYSSAPCKRPSDGWEHIGAKHRTAFVLCHQWWSISSNLTAGRQVLIPTPAGVGTQGPLPWLQPPPLAVLLPPEEALVPV